MMLELPTLLLTANVSGVFTICTQLEDSIDPVVCDASRLIVAEPMALCALVATLPEVESEQSRAAPFWQGAVVGVELLLHALNAVNFYEIPRKYNPDPDLPIRFI